MRKKMPHPQQRVALDMILTQSDHGGMSDAAIELHRRQAEDAERMDKRMSEIEKKVDSLDAKVDALDTKVDEIKALMTSRSSFKESLKEVLTNKVFLYLLMITIASIFGVQVADVGAFLFK